jgi:poly(3-hydroxybutyrate) depolymerase
LNPKNTGALTGSVLSFNQNPFSPTGVAADVGMADMGYVFVPTSCATGQPCALILALHGCLQYHGAIGRTFIDDSGINQWADTNNIVVLYPQVTPISANPEGCWDWWGYLRNPNYAQQAGPQMSALYHMVAHAAGL